jgi:CRISPR system Cascade subunit CasD
MVAFVGWTIYAPFASWGMEAVGEMRGSQQHATRSAILGLVGAALGVRRDDADTLLQLDNGYGVAVRVDCAGDSLSDYHTAQSAPAKLFRRAAPRTRRELLERGRAADELKTVLSRRSYRVGSLHRVVLWQAGAGPWTLEQVAAALSRPQFVVFAGRKANPLGRPMNPQVVSADSLEAAFRLLFDSTTTPDVPAVPATEDVCEVHHDPCVGFPSALPPGRRSMPRDRSVSRAAWMFRTRPMVTSEMTVRGGEG